MILVSHTIISQYFLFLGLILYIECIGTSDFLRLMDALYNFFWTITGIDVINLDRMFLQDWVEWYYERHWIFLWKKEWRIMQMQLQWWLGGIVCQTIVHMIQWNQLIQTWKIHKHMFWNIYHIDCKCKLFSSKNLS